MTQADLIERLEKGEGADRELDGNLYVEFFIPKERIGRLDQDGGVVGWWPKNAPYVSAIDVPRYTASLDAAISLVERMRPGAEYEITNLYAVACATLPLNSEDEWHTGRHKGGSLPRALLIALLKSLQAGDAE